MRVKRLSTRDRKSGVSVWLQQVGNTDCETSKNQRVAPYPQLRVAKIKTYI